MRREEEEKKKTTRERWRERWWGFALFRIEKSRWWATLDRADLFPWSHDAFYRFANGQRERGRERGRGRGRGKKKKKKKRKRREETREKQKKEKQFLHASYLRRGDFVPVYPVKASCRHTIWRRDGSNIQPVFQRVQLPLTPAFAFTDYKCQGRTLRKAIVDLAEGVTSTGVYVMLSRVQRLDDLLILRPFKESVLDMKTTQLANTKDLVVRIPIKHLHTSRSSPFPCPRDDVAQLPNWIERRIAARGPRLPPSCLSLSR